jgi:predicted transcriptional regulator
MLQISTTKKSMAFDKQRWRIFGDWLKNRREEAKLSQDGLADLVGVDRQTIYRLENALSGTKRETVNALAEALRVNKAEALNKAGFAVQENGIIQKPKSVVEFIERLNEMGFEIQFDADLTKLTPDDLQDLIDSIEANLLVKTRKL